MAVHPLDIPNDTTPDVVSTPIQGKPARILASAQGNCWQGISDDHAIIERTDTLAAVDARGDQLASMLATLLRRIAATARRERAPQTESMLHEAIATFERICELDDHEDDHRRQIRAHAIGATAATLDASQQIGAVLGQRDAVCGRTRGEAGGIEFEPCSQPAGHALDGKVCVFLARERPANWTAGPKLRPMGAPVGGRAQMEAVSRWSRSHRACVACHRDTVPHAGHGLCRSCYPKARLAAPSQEG